MPAGVGAVHRAHRHGGLATVGDAVDFLDEQVRYPSQGHSAASGRQDGPRVGLVRRFVAQAEFIAWAKPDRVRSSSSRDTVVTVFPTTMGRSRTCRIPCTRNPHSRRPSVIRGTGKSWIVSPWRCPPERVICSQGEASAPNPSRVTQRAKSGRREPIAALREQREQHRRLVPTVKVGEPKKRAESRHIHGVADVAEAVCLAVEAEKAHWGD